MSSTARTVVLIHGGWHGAWCWHRLTPLLRAQGREVVAPDLPSMGEDHTDPATITLTGWTRFVTELVAQQRSSVMLVGHSRAGAIVSQVAEAVPELIDKLVYLAAYLLPSGRSVADEARDDSGSLLPANMVAARSGTTCTLRPEIVGEAFYGRCSPEDRRDAISRLSPEPLKPLATKVQVSAARFGVVPRVYVETTADRAISLAAQRRMHGALSCERVITLDADHSPFLSCPEQLAQELGRL